MPLVGADHRESFAELEASHPLLLLPVRLETIFDGRDLCVRIYPDQIHGDAFEERLTAKELSWAKTFWRRYLSEKPGADPDAARSWLVDLLGARRAAWVARRTKPKVTEDGQLRFPRRNVREEPARTVAACLPDRWAVIGWIQEAQVFAKFTDPVGGNLGMAPDLASAATWSEDEDALPVDPALAWMVDYSEAVRVGMALTVSLSAEDYGRAKEHGLRLIAVGVRGETPQDGAKALAKLLRGHLYSDGLAFLPQGTPTNNTDSAAAGWTPEIDDVAGFFGRELGETASPDAPDCAAVRLTAALGLPDAKLLPRVADGGSLEEASGRAMNRVLWQVTWGRYVRDLLSSIDDDQLMSSGTLTQARDWFIANVRAGASLPTLSIGAQPYGVLPVRRTNMYRSISGPFDQLEWLLLKLRERWRDSVGEVPRLDPVEGDGIGEDPDQDIVAILGSLAHPARFVARRLTYQREIRLFFWDWTWLMIEQPSHDLYPITTWYNANDHRITGIRSQLTVLGELREELPTLFPGRAKREDAEVIVDAMIDMAEMHLARQDPIHAYFPGAVDGVFDDDVEGDPKLFWSGYGNATEDRLFTRELVEAEDPLEGQSAAEYLLGLRRRVPSVRRPGLPALDLASTPYDDPFSGGGPLLHQLIDAVIDDVPELERTPYRSALQVLAGTPPEQLELRLRETLGLATHRLDAWVTGLARERLDGLRERRPTGVQVGGFGWVEDLRPDAAGTRESQGFIHAPSLGHAATAAVLRAGWQSHGRGEQSPFAVNLRSDRVRLAAWLLDGVRQGQALGELLGYRFERELHERELDVHIDTCRRRVLESEGVNRAPRGPVDGLKLAALYEGAGVRLDDGATLRAGSTVSQAALRGLNEALEGILASMDAVADASIADSVHALLEGNRSRASATLEAITTGAVPPPRLSFLDTPRRGPAVTHRALISLGDDAPATGALGWGEAGPRAELEPALNAWVASLLGAPSRAVIAVRLLDAAGSTTATVPMGMDLVVAGQGLSALDVVAEAPPGAIAGDTSWSRRCEAVGAELVADAGHTGSWALDYTAEGLLEGAGGSLEELAELARTLRTLLATARPLEARDLVAPGGTEPVGWDLEELESRVGSLTASFGGLVGSLASALAVATPDEVAVSGLLVALGAFGVGPPVAVEDAVALAAGVLGAAEGRVTRLTAIDEEAGLAVEPSDETRLAWAQARVAAALGPGSVVLPRLRVVDPVAVGAVFAESESLLGGDPATATAWLQQVAKARPEMARLLDVVWLAELMADARVATPVVGQLPVVAGQGWVAVEAPLDRTQGHLALFALDDGALGDPAQPLRGLVIDSWSERLPAEDLVSGVAAHFDAPTSRAPQALLLVVPPEGEEWSFDLVVDSLAETLEWAKLRAVDPEVLQGHGHQAPAIFVPNGVSAGAQPEGGI